MDYISHRISNRVKNIWVSGSIAQDLIMDFPGRFADHIDPRKIHLINLSFAVLNLQKNIGGTAANIAYNLALLEEHPQIIAAIGEDQSNLQKYFQKIGIGVRFLKISKRLPTAAAYIITDQDDNQIAGFHAGAMNEPAKLNIPCRRGDWAVVAAENPRNMALLSTFYRRRGVDYIFDPGQQITALSKKDLAAGLTSAKVLIGNDYEIGMISRRLSLREVPSARGGRATKQSHISPRLLPPTLRQGRNDTVVVRTLGPKGSEILIAPRKKIKIGIARPKTVKDPTGAGDAYRAGFLKGLILGYNLEIAGQLGATTASYAVEHYGTQNHHFSWDEIIRRHNKNFNEKLLK